MAPPFPFRVQLGLRDAIFATVGGAPEYINAVGVTRFSTNGKPSNTDGWVVQSENNVYHFGCFRQGLKDCWSERAARQPVSKADVMRASQSALADEQDRQKRAHINEAIWKRARPLLAASPTGRYLLHRGLDLDGYPSALRMATLPCFDGSVDYGRLPVMLGAVTDQYGTLLALHRTFLTLDGHKANVPHPKKLTRTSASTAGASIKLRPPQIVENKVTLGVAEGIETALACWLGSHVPTWSCVSANGIKTFDLPAELERLIVFADHDVSGVGQAAARELAARAAAAGLEVRVLVPLTAGADWLDVYVGDAK